MTVTADGYLREPAGTDGSGGAAPWWPYRPADAASPDGLRPVTLTAIPYFAWSNRGPGAMRVWIPRRERS
jgi:DUF1680 family protein